MYRDLIQQRRNDPPKELIEVEHDRARFIDRFGPILAEFVGLPDEVDEFANSPVDSAEISGIGTGVQTFLEEIGEIAEFGQYRPSGGFRSRSVR